MQTECSPTLFEFEPVERHKVVAGFDGGIITSDAGGLLLGRLDRGLGLIRRMARCFTDRRDPRLLEHTVETLVGQRVFALALGYEDLNDHDELRHDLSLLLIGNYPTYLTFSFRIPIFRVLEGRSEMAKKGPGRAYREGLTIVQLMDMFPTEEAATAWFESVLWPDGERHCGKCGSVRTRAVPSAKPMPYWCTDCRGYFSVRTGTPLARSNVPMRKWVIAIYLCLTSLKSVSSMKLSRDIGVKQETAWFMLHRIRQAWALDDDDQFDGPVEVDETYFGGKRKNMSKAKRKALTGRGPTDKTAVIGAKDRDTKAVRAKVIKHTDSETLHGFVAEHAATDAMIYTDDAKAYNGLPYDHESVRHSVGEYVRDMAHTNGIESFWAMLKRAHKGTFHKISPKHLNRYVQEFAGKNNIRDSGTLAQMRDTVARLVGRNLLYRDLIADNGLSSGARS